MSSWKDSSDFASLAAALSQTKKLSKSSIVTVNNEKEIEKDKISFKNVNTEADKPQNNGSSSLSLPPSRTYKDFADTLKLPLKDSITLKQHKSTVSALEFESSGSRFLSGSHDFSVAYWDFNGMVKDQPEPFRFIEPMGSYTIRSLKYSKDSQWVLMAASSSCTKLFDRNGSQVREFCKGDPYIRDLKHTTGHVAGISTAIWLPNDYDRFLTASEDGTLRIWHIGYRQKSEYFINVKSSGSGGRSAVTSAEFFNNDILLTGSCDGSIKLWDAKSLTSNSSLPIKNLNNSHIFGDKISSFSIKDSNIFASRSTDGTVKLWDKRNLTIPINVYNDLPTIHGETSVIFVKENILTGTTNGISILDLNDSNLRKNISLQSTTTSAVAGVTLAWNEKTDQILIGSSNGKIEIFYDSEMGNGKGILLMKQSASASRIDGEVDISSGEIYNSSGTGIYDKSSTSRAPSKRKLDKIRSDPIKTHRPELPSYGPGQGGKIGSNVTQTIMKSVLKDTSRDIDPRAALLSYAEKAANNPKFVTTAYQETQPVTILDSSLLDKEVAIEEEKKRKLEEVERLKNEKEMINNRFK